MRRNSSEATITPPLKAFVGLACLIACACGDDQRASEPGSDESEPALQPITPLYGENESAFESVGIAALIAQGYSGAGIDVCVVDTGIDSDHPGFAHLFERDAVVFLDFTSERSPTPVDTNGHGTHVAGIIAMSGALTGGAPNANLLIARVFTADGGSDSGTIGRAVDWCRESRSDVISMSLGGLTFPAIEALLNENPTLIEQAVERALEAGIYVVAAAGNTEITRDVATPANVAQVIAVGALDADLETKASFSQSGLNDGGPLSGRAVAREDPDRKPEVSAPGVGIVSAMASGSTLANDVSGCADTLYCALNGTSQATPFVTAALALVLEAQRELQPENSGGRQTIERVKEALAESATKLIGQDEPHDDGRGYGRLRADTWRDRL